VWRIAWNTLPGEYILSDMSKGRIIFSWSLSSECGRIRDCRKTSRGRCSGGARSLESSPFLGVFVQTWTKCLIFCSQSVAQFAEGLHCEETRFNDLGEMKACLQSRCSPSELHAPHAPYNYMILIVFRENDHLLS